MCGPGKAISDNPNVCTSCASLLDDIQDTTITESAIPYEFDSGTQKTFQDQPPTVPVKPSNEPKELSPRKPL